MKKIIIGLLLVAGTIALAWQYHLKNTQKRTALKLYWFIPDGLRAEPDLFKIYEWAQNGELPNIRRMMENGSYGYSIPVFPTHTPVNFATILTGSLPKTHGVADGPMHVEGFPLEKISAAGFSSTARRIPAVWTMLEEKGLNVAVISTPGSTPPEIQNGTVLRGRWGGWGADVHALNFEYKGSGEAKRGQGRGSRLFFLGPRLTSYLDFSESKWETEPASNSPAKKVELEGWGWKAHAAVVDSTDDAKANYDSVVFSQDSKTPAATLKQGEWSKWFPATLKIKEQTIQSHVCYHVIKVGADGFFRVRVLFDNLNDTVTQPASASQLITSKIGPMVDFVDNFPPQLISYEEDKATFLNEMQQSFDWHKRLIPFFVEKFDPQVVIHNVYNPNQMLSSRWWLGHIDPDSHAYAGTSDAERAVTWSEVKAMYKEVDRMLGEILETADENTVIAFGSDHGMAALNTSVRLNNYFASKGWLKFTIDPDTGEPKIDWEKSKVIYLKMDGVFIHPEGLAGNWKRGAGPEYEKLRSEVAQALIELSDEKGLKPVVKLAKWEEVPESLGLPSDRVGDLVIANRLGYGWDEEMSEDNKVFVPAKVAGYKQAIMPEDGKAVWTPFMIMGPGVKKGHFISEPVQQIDQLPTILKAMQEAVTHKMDGKPLTEVFKD